MIIFRKYHTWKNIAFKYLKVLGIDVRWNAVSYVFSQSETKKIKVADPIAWKINIASIYVYMLSLLSFECGIRDLADISAVFQVNKAIINLWCCWLKCDGHELENWGKITPYHLQRYFIGIFLCNYDHTGQFKLNFIMDYSIRSNLMFFY